MSAQRDPHSADMAMRTCGSAIWADTDPRGAYVMHRAKWDKHVGPTGIVGQDIALERGEHHEAH